MPLINTGSQVPDMHTKSYMKRLYFLLEILIVLLVGISVTAVIVTGYTAVREMKDSEDKYLTEAINCLDTRLDSIQSLFERFLYDNTDYNLIQLDDESQRQHVAVRLQHMMANTLEMDRNAQTLIVADGKYDQCLDASNILLDANQKKKMREFVLEYAKKDDNTFLPLGIYEIGDGYYVMEMTIRNRKACAVFQSVRAMMESALPVSQPAVQSVLTDTDDRVLWSDGKQYCIYEPGGQLEENIKMPLRRIGNDIRSIGRFYVVDSYTSLWAKLRGTLLFLVASILVVSLFSLYLRRDINHHLIKPMEALTQEMELIRQGDLKHRIMAGHTEYKEFQTLVTTFNQLMDQIVNLKIRNYEEKIALQEAEQKYIRLQLRPHFFLNAMTTVSSLSKSGKNQEIEKNQNVCNRHIRSGICADGVFYSRRCYDTRDL